MIHVDDLCEFLDAFKHKDHVALLSDDALRPDLLAVDHDVWTCYVTYEKCSNQGGISFANWLEEKKSREAQAQQQPKRVKRP